MATAINARPASIDIAAAAGHCRLSRQWTRVPIICMTAEKACRAAVIETSRDVRSVRGSDHGLLESPHMLHTNLFHLHTVLDSSGEIPPRANELNLRTGTEQRPRPIAPEDIFSPEYS